MPNGSGADMPTFLMEQHPGFSQVDLKKELGGQSVMSEIPNRKRELSVHQMRAPWPLASASTPVCSFETHER